MAERVHVEVAYLPMGRAPYLRTLELPLPATVGDALDACDVFARHPELDARTAPLGVFGRRVDRDRPLHDGDRVEIYRALHLDPMQARRRRAQQRAS